MGVINLSLAFKQSQKISNLNICNNSIGDDAMINISNILKNTKLK